MQYFVWSSAGKRVTVRLHLKMVGYMVRWIREAPECFGMLLGRIRKGWNGLVVTVDDFEPFDIAALSGRPRPPAGTGLPLVGLYRRTMKDDLRLDHVDASLIESSFGHRGMVYLLIAAAVEGPDRASFFTAQDGEVHGYRNEGEFPFDAEFLRGGVISRSAAR
jgi:hypothetical protein